MHAFIAAGLEATAFGSAKAGPVIGHVLVALADPAPRVVALALRRARAEVIMLMAKDRRQPPSIRRPRDAGIRPSTSAARPIAPSTTRWLGSPRGANQSFIGFYR